MILLTKWGSILQEGYRMKLQTQPYEAGRILETRQGETPNRRKTCVFLKQNQVPLSKLTVTNIAVENHHLFTVIGNTS